MKHIDIINKKFGRLLAKEEICKTVKCGMRCVKEYHIICICDCGKEITTRKSNLVFGHTTSCGCLRIDSLVRTNKMHLLPPGEAAFNLILRSYKNIAKKRNLEWDISKDLFRTITSSNCFYCGLEPKQSALGKKSHSTRYYYLKNGDYLYNGIDRINNDLGYIPKNIVPCCGNCNIRKNNMTIDEFYSWIKKIYSHLSLNNFQFPTGISFKNDSL